MSAAHQAVFDRVLAMPPVDTTYVAGRWHHDRVALGGYVIEARILLKSLTVPRNRNKRFLIIGRARSGTTLLTRLLNSHSQIQCDGEVLKRNVLFPGLLLDRLAGKSSAPVYGAKLLSYQMAQVHRMRDPHRFLARLAANGVVLIHLQRDTFFQTLSLTIAQKRKQFHSDKGASALKRAVPLDPVNFVERVAWSLALLEYERAALDGLDHMVIRYDTDLTDAAGQARTLAAICARLGVPEEPAETPLKKVLPTDPARIIENYDEVRDHLVAAGLGDVLPS
ncbi:MAG: hypothetical protein HLUCCA08_00320 [Rhodobacteraceae bacterium HLUCCA08]|nr:MAG: hypothetical protein HLUCCA08_00320 [Rhodobacteraceae bacterium HLUCCA08]